MGSTFRLLCSDFERQAVVEGVPKTESETLLKEAIDAGWTCSPHLIPQHYSPQFPVWDVFSLLSILFVIALNVFALSPSVTRVFRVFVLRSPYYVYFVYVALLCCLKRSSLSFQSVGAISGAGPCAALTCSEIQHFSTISPQTAPAAIILHLTSPY